MDHFDGILAEVKRFKNNTVIIFAIWLLNTLLVSSNISWHFHLFFIAYNAFVCAQESIELETCVVVNVKPLLLYGQDISLRLLSSCVVGNWYSVHSTMLYIF